MTIIFKDGRELKNVTVGIIGDALYIRQGEDYAFYPMDDIKAVVNEEDEDAT